MLSVTVSHSYDDWFDTPFLLGGESKAHVDIAREFGVAFEHLPYQTDVRQYARHSRVAQPCGAGVLFRVRSVHGSVEFRGGSAAPSPGGAGTGHGISPFLALRSCHRKTNVYAQVTYFTLNLTANPTPIV